jgi:uncharacterized protein (TIGR01777 family)
MTTLTIGLTGASGFIGSHVARLARERGHRVVAYSRHPHSGPAFDEVRAFSLDAPPDVSGLDAIVHLAGESIMGLWTTEKKRRIRDSRVRGTHQLVKALNATPRGPRVLVSGSAIGYYGDTGDTAVTEASPAGAGFLAEVAQAWEHEAAQARDMRVTFLRSGLVLGRDGGAMRLIGPVFRAGLGGPLGNGRQWMSCIHVEDVAGLILHAIETETVAGPLNAVLPEPVRNAHFTRALARAAHRPAILPAPAFALKLALGELSSLLLDSQRVLPEAALASGYAFRFPTLEAAATDVLA